MGTEIERKWVLKDVDKIPLYVDCGIEQGYLSDVFPNIRVRKATALNGEVTFYLTSKTGHGLTRHEVECVISNEMGTHLLLAAEWVLRKTRYYVPLPNWQKGFVDVFHGALEGLVVLEIEFPSEEDANAFEFHELTAPFILEEVTDDPRYENANLAKSGVIPYGAPD
jgi:adenylate cyclase